MRPVRSLFAFAASLAFSSSAAAQMPPGHPMIPGQGGRLPLLPNAGGFGHGNVDCAINAAAVVVKERRTAAQVDVTFRVRGVRGGMCVVRPEAIDFSTDRKALVSRALQELAVDGQPILPMAVADAPNGDRLRPWASNLSANEEHVLAFRYFIEGDITSGGEVDVPGHLAVHLRHLGPRVFVGAPVTVKIVVEPRVQARTGMWLGDEKTPPQAASPNDAGVYESSGHFDTKNTAIVVNWRYENGVPPAATPQTMGTSGLATLEYLRDGLARDLSIALLDPKDEKRVAAGWDQAFDIAFDAARSDDPFVAAEGVRTLAWLASGLSPSATSVRAEDAKGEGVPVPAQVAAAVANVPAAYATATGNKVAPSPIGARSVRGLVPKLADDPQHKKDAEAALKRLAKRIDDGKVTAFSLAGVTKTAGAFPALPSPVPPTAKVLSFGPRGAFLPGEEGAAVPKRPIAARLVHALSHRAGLVKAFLGITVLGAAAFLLAIFARDKNKTPGAREKEAL